MSPLPSLCLARSAPQPRDFHLVRQAQYIDISQEAEGPGGRRETGGPPAPPAGLLATHGSRENDALRYPRRRHGLLPSVNDSTECKPWYAICQAWRECFFLWPAPQSFLTSGRKFRCSPFCAFSRTVARCLAPQRFRELTIKLFLPPKSCS